MNIIFSEINKVTYYFALLIRFFGIAVFFIDIADNISETSLKKLVSRKISPLPIEKLPSIGDISPYSKGFNTFIYKHLVGYLNQGLFLSQEPLYQNINDLYKKILIIIKSKIDVRAIYKANLWAETYPNDSHILFLSKLSATSEKRRNVFTSNVFVLLDLFCVIPYKAFIYIFKNLKLGHNKLNSRNEVNNQTEYNEKFGFVVHKGLDDELNNKNHYYRDSIDSDLHKNNILHITYSGDLFKIENKNLKVLNISSKKYITYLKHFIKSFVKGFPHIRNVNNFIVLLHLSSIYSKYEQYKLILASYNQLRAVFIDFDILCVKELLLAFESRSIKTIAFQERFLMTFNNSFGVFLSHYLCASSFTMHQLQHSESYCVQNYYPVGQYRSDELFKDYNPPDIIRPYIDKKKIVAVLGFHAANSKHHSLSHPLINWTASEHFLKDIISLAQTYDNALFVLRYKMLDWCNLPFFNSILKKVDLTPNILFLDKYNEDFLSYKLCKYSDLVIAKHTSIGDECLSVGIPVLFHDYSHNCDNQVSNIFSYPNFDIMCSNYEELTHRVAKVLNQDEDYLESFIKLKSMYFEDFGDGKVVDRANNIIDSIISSK